MQRMRITTILIATLLAGACAVTDAAAQESICASVKIEIQQELTAEREAFRARMRIVNGLDTVALEHVTITLSFADDAGEPVVASSDPDATDAAFFVRVDAMSGITDVAGAGQIPGRGVAEVQWLIVPSPGAGGLRPAGERYRVGARLEYTLGGEPTTVEVVPDTITVLPQPRLVLDYFLTENVYGDDPFTPAIEPAEPFSLGLRASNVGFGTAHAVAIDSAQPQIIDNQQHLVVGFRLLASSVEDQPVTPTLLLDLGDLDPGASRVGRWVMESSLSGHFDDFLADFTHADELGGRLTSLIEEVRTHFLIHDVRVDLPGRDGVRDFLALDGDVVRVYESDAIDTLVTNHSSVASVAVQDGRIVVTVPLTAGPLWVKVPDLFAGAHQVESAMRSDGKVLPVDNVWFARAGDDHFLELFDANGGGQYVIETGVRSSGPRAPVIGFLIDRAAMPGDHIGFIVQASDPDGTVPALTTGVLPVGASFTDGGNGQGTFDWPTTLQQTGTYAVTFRASDGVLESTRTMQIFLGVTTPTPGETPTPLRSATPVASSTPGATATPSPSPVVTETSGPATPSPTASPTPAGLDHVTCYKAAAHGSPRFLGIADPPGVALHDQFGTSTVAVKKSKYLCAPTDKLGEDPTAPAHAEHLKAYQIKSKTKFVHRQGVRLIDQFNQTGLVVDVTKPSHLLVPSAKSLSGPPPTPAAFVVDHFQCYAVKVAAGSPRFAVIAGVTLEDQFGPMTVEVRKPKFLCLPVDARGESPGAETHADHLMCYQVKQTDDLKFAKRKGVFVHDQFGPETVDLTKPSELCVPALRSP